MSNEDLKLAAETVLQNDEWYTMRTISFFPEYECDTEFVVMASPERILALIAENESLRKALIMIRDEADDLRICEIAADALVDANRSPENT